MESLENIEEIFGEAKVVGSELRPFVFNVHSVDSSHLAIHVTDFRFHTFESTHSLLQLDDLRDDIGIGGSWSDFIDYFMSSFNFHEVKLVLHGDLTSQTGTDSAKLVCQKRKGMPVISIPLKRLTDSDATEAIANISLKLFQAYKNTHESCVKEKDCAAQPTTIARLVDQSESIKNTSEQYSKKIKLQGADSSEDIGAHTVSNKGLQSPEKQAPRDNGTTKVTSRVVPAYRRARVRGALLQDSEDNEDKKP